MNKSNEKWGFLRETQLEAIKSGIEEDTGLHRTGLDEYLKTIFPEVHDWIHDKTIDVLPKEIKCRKRPDYRSESLKLIIEFDGAPHFQYPDQILKDKESTKLYESFGYKVVRIPFFIQLTNNAVETLFGVKVEENLFNTKYPSLGINRNNPASLCPAGIDRMAEIFSKFPEQYEVNLTYLKSLNNDYLTGASLLEAAYNKIKRGR